MSGPQFERQSCRPRDHLIVAGRTYPTAWRSVDEFRAERGMNGLPDWPAWCFLPLSASYAIVSADAGLPRLPLELTGDVGRLGALAAWRVTQGIYRFDPAVYDAVRDTPVDREIPCDVLYRLPEWCVYLETPGMTWGASPLHGVFSHLEWDVNHQRVELRLVMDSEAALTPVPLHLGAWPLAESIDRARTEGLQLAKTHGLEWTEDAKRLQQAGKAGVDMVAAELSPVISLLLYLCSQASEIGDGRRQPQNPDPVRTKRGWRLFPADKPTTWDVGVRLGSLLRKAYQAEQVGEPTSSHAGPRPHVRRAHWHGFWSGPRDGERRFELRWLPPIPVNLDDPEGLPATVRPVK